MWFGSTMSRCLLSPPPSPSISAPPLAPSFVALPPVTGVNFGEERVRGTCRFEVGGWG